MADNGNTRTSNEEFERARASGDYSSLRLWTVSWSDFNQPPFISRVKNIAGFLFSAQLSGLGMWSQIVRSNRLALELHRELEDALTEAKFLNLPAIETRIEQERVMFRYDDTDYGFTLLFTGDGRVQLQRDGSSLETFHRWYTGFMPSMPAILNRAIAVIDGEVANSLRPDDGMGAQGSREREFIRLLTASFTFRVICHNLHSSSGEALNVDVMRRNVAVRVPDVRGRMCDAQGELPLERYGRMDYKVSVRHPTLPGISQFLTVEAPSNAGWSGLFIDLSYVGENYYTLRASGGGRLEDRVALDSELFLSSARCADAYISFFRDLGLLGFVESVTDGFQFDTSPGPL